MATSRLNRSGPNRAADLIRYFGRADGLAIAADCFVDAFVLGDTKDAARWMREIKAHIPPAQIIELTPERRMRYLRRLA